MVHVVYVCVHCAVYMCGEYISLWVLNVLLNVCQCMHRMCISAVFVCHCMHLICVAVCTECASLCSEYVSLCVLNVHHCIQ